MKPSPRLSISRNEIRAVYAQEEAAVIELVERLVARINALEERVEAARGTPLVSYGALLRRYRKGCPYSSALNISEGNDAGINTNSSSG